MKNGERKLPQFTHCAIENRQNECSRILDIYLNNVTLIDYTEMSNGTVEN